MNAREAAFLCRLAKTACPQQAVDEFTPDAWHFLMDDIDFEDAKAALRTCVRAKPFVAPAEIIAEVKRIRGKRIEKFGPVEPPPGLPDDEYRDWFIGVRTRIASGSLTRAQWDAERAALGYTGNRKPPELEGVFRRIDVTDHDPRRQPAEQETADA